LVIQHREPERKCMFSQGSHVLAFAASPHHGSQMFQCSSLCVIKERLPPSPRTLPPRIQGLSNSVAPWTAQPQDTDASGCGEGVGGVQDVAGWRAGREGEGLRKLFPLTRGTRIGCSCTIDVAVVLSFRLAHQARPASTSAGCRELRCAPPLACSQRSSRRDLFHRHTHV
jgi:hypothetical protein